MILVLFLLASVVAIFFGTGAGYYAQIITSGILCGYAFLNTKNIHVKWSLFHFVLFLMIFSSILVGAFNVIINRNEVRPWVIYSLLFSFHYIGFRAGSKLVVADKVRFDKFLVYHGALEFGQLISRFAVLGAGIRSSYGFTYLFPWLNLYISERRLGSLFSAIAFLLFAGVVALSGLRSVTIFGALVLIAAIYFMLSRFQGSSARKSLGQLLKIGILVMIAVIPLYSMNKVRIDRAMNIVVVRFEQTLLNDQGVKLDPNSGRSEESQAAILSFQTNKTIFDELLGRGFGFSYYEGIYETEKKAHIHITPVAYYLRSGVLGAFVFSYVLLISVFMVFKSIRRKDIRVYAFILLIWAFSANFAGLILSSSFWFFLGGCTELSKRRYRTRSDVPLAL